MPRGDKDGKKKEPLAENKYKDIVGSFSTMGKHNDEEAAALLQKIASNVRPIMKKRGWFVGTLKEFYPANPSLLGLNMNHGQQIMIRLRRQGDDKSFFDFEHCLGTMLHELCHIVRGPHDAQFYKLLDELNKEYDDLVASGFKGDGFDAPGRRVGEGVSHDVAPHVAREKALEAIQKRLRYNGWVGTAQSGQKLGGSSDLKSLERMLNPGQLAAMAAEKRAEKDRIWCGSDEQEAANGSTSGANGEPERATSSNSLVEEPARNSNDVPMDFTKDDDDVIPLERPQKKAGESSKTTTVRKEIEVINLDSDEDDSAGVVALGKRPHPKPRATYKPAIWSCSVCTLSNPLTADICGACDTPRPGWNPERAQHTQGWYCPSCMTHNPDDRFRMCSSCQFVRAL